MSKTAQHTRSRSKHKGIKSEIRVYQRRMRVISTVIALAIVICILTLFSYYLISCLDNSPSPTNYINEHSDDHQLRAALVDALYSRHPNEVFTKSVNTTLQEAGFKVDIYQGTEVTVDFLKKLPEGYQLMILRMHSASSTEDQLYLFTAEPYSVGKYTQEQYFQLVKEAYADDNSPPVFAVNWAFVKRCMTGRFNGTLVIMMGCDGTYDSMIVEELILQGAIGYIAWNGPITLSHTDKAIPYLVQALYTEKLSVEQAVNETNREIGCDPLWSTVLDYYLP